MKPIKFFLIAIIAATETLAPFGRASAFTSELEGLTLEALLNVPIKASSFTDEKPSESGALAHVITEETIKARGYSTLLDLLEDMPQIEIAHLAGTDTGNILTVQGINGNERIQIFIDGTRVTPVTGNFYALGRQFSLKNAKRVEIVLGPMSALYGADAFTGVINIVTKSGEDLENQNLSGSYGNYNTQNYSAVAGGKIRFLENAFFSVTADSYHSDGPSMPKYHSSDFSWYNSEYQTGRMKTFTGETTVPFRDFNADENAFFTHVRLSMNNFELGWVKMSESHSSSLGMKPEYSLYAEDAIVKTNYETLSGNHIYRSENEKWTFNTSLSSHFYELDPETKFINIYSNYDDAYKYARDKSSVIEEKANCKIGEESLFLFGLSYQDHLVLPRTADLSSAYNRDLSADSQGFVYPGSDIYDSSGTYLGISQDFYFNEYSNTGAYAQFNFKEYSAVQATLGIRYDRNSRYGDYLNPRAGLVFKPHKKTNFKLLYGEAFLAPSPDKTYQHYGSFYADTNTVTGLRSSYFYLPNTDLKPEKIRSFQLEASYKFTDTFWLSFNGYNSYVYDMIRTKRDKTITSFKGVPVSYIQTFVNTDDIGRIYGGTLRMDAITNLGKIDMVIYAAYTYSEGYSEGATFLSYSAKDSARAGVDATFGRWSISPRFIYQSRSYNRNLISGTKQSSDPFAIMNFYAKYNDIPIGDKELSIFLNIQNLTNARYSNPTRAPDEGFGASPQDPISIYGGLTLKF